MKNLVQRHRTQRWVAFFLAMVMMFSLLASTMSVVAAQESTAETAEMTADDTTAKLGDGEYDIYKDLGDPYDQEFAADFNEVMERSEVGFVGDLIINGLEYILKKAYNKAEGKAIDKVWNIIFGGGDTSNKEILDKLNQMDGKLDDMNKQLTNIMNLIAEDSIKKEINAKLEVMGKFDKSLSTDFRHYNEAETEADKHAALDSWHDRAYQPMKNSFELTEWYCEKITNEKGTNMDGDFFTNYDKYAYLHWPWENSGVPFRQIQRERDLYLITQMMAMNYLWLQKEYEADPANVKKYKGDVESLEKSVNKVIKLYTDKKVQYNKGTNRIHYGKASLKIALDPGRRLEPQFYFDKHVKFLHDAHDLDNAVRNEMVSLKPSNTTLITKSAMFDILAASSRAEALKPDSKIKSLRDLLKAGEFMLAKDDTRIYYEGRVQGSPLFHNYNEGHMNIYINNVDMTKTGKDVEANTFVCSGPTEVFNHDVFFRVNRPENRGRYEVIEKSEDHTAEFFKNIYTNIWVYSASNIEEDHLSDVTDHPDEEATVDVTIKSIDEWYNLEGTLDDGSNLSFWIQEGVPVEGKTREELKVGDKIKLTYIKRTQNPEADKQEMATKVVYIDPNDVTPSPSPTAEPGPDPSPTAEPDPNPSPTAEPSPEPTGGDVSDGTS